LKLYHCSGAAAIVRSSMSAIRWVARWRSAGFEDGTPNASSASTWKRPSFVRRTAIGAIIAPVLAARTAGPAGSVVQAPNSLTGIPSLRYPQSTSSAMISLLRRTLNSSRRFRHGTTCTPQDSRCRRRISKISGKAESSATTFAGSPRQATAAATASLLPT
jgi:hypothetical protein